MLDFQFCYTNNLATLNRNQISCGLVNMLSSEFTESLQDVHRKGYYSFCFKIILNSEEIHRPCVKFYGTRRDV